MRSKATSFAISSTSTASSSEERSDEFSAAFTSLLVRVFLRENKNYIVALLLIYAISTTNTLAMLVAGVIVLVL